MPDLLSEQNEIVLDNEDSIVVTNSASQLLVDWANGQDGWVRKIVALVLATRSPVDSESFEDLFAHYLAEKRLSETEPAVVPAIQLLDAASEDGSVLKLLSLENVQGVNALASNQNIAFNEGITVIFGENGAGKTGYTRILKRIAKARSAEDIIRNVHNGAISNMPSAEIGWALDGVAGSSVWSNEEGFAPLDRMDVFDSPSVLMHLDNDLSYAYTPADLALFKYASDAISRVSELAATSIEAKKPKKNTFLPLFGRGSSVYALVETLGPATDLQGLRTLAELSDQEAADLTALPDIVEALKGDSVRAQLTVANNRQSVNTQILALAAALAKLDREKYNQAVGDLKAAEDGQRKLKATISEHHEIPAADSDEWHVLITAGDNYRKHLHLDDYPSDVDTCLYCRQALSPDALVLLQTYKDLANNAGQLMIGQSNRLLDEYSRDILACDLERLERDIETLGAIPDDDEHMKAATVLVAAAKNLSTELVAKRSLGSDPIAPLLAPASKEAQARIDASGKLITELNQRSADRTAKLAESQAKLLNLKARSVLNENFSDIETYVEDTKWVESLRIAAARIPSTQAGLTAVAKQASTLLLNNNFDTRFQEECRKLRAPEVQLDFPGRKGASRRVKTVTSHKPSAILSEGEQKVIAMADFLAESSLRFASSPVIFDDPVNSLDYRRIGEVSSRIARLAEERQVIVFTHNIWFATELLSRFDKNTTHCSYFSIQDDGPLKGIVSPGTHPRWDTVKKMTGKVNAILQSAKAAEGEAREALVEKGYSLVRSWCEVVVEQEFLQQVVQRYQPNVMLTKLDSIDGKKLDEAKKVIVPIYEKACRIMDGHSQPLETLSVRPKLEELEAEWKQLQEVRPKASK
ncbi:AAA family ATPase [Arthrobacter sp. MI7-26]|uniref:AAA family ATPase n=1 Tax=Arthrobacter sp. MI7-26 TaxID=2993653 RepID=UPI00224957D8|nr:AAA family ATPase [Arthrobacter sp. MI7-26]MCX2746290.1 AAA family ATPase [Arthrobacter sp. MI7-26]